MKYISPDLHALLRREIEFPVGHVEEPVPVVEECHDDIDAVLGDWMDVSQVQRLL